MNDGGAADVGSPERWRRLSEDLRIPLTDDQIEALRAYGRWLADEAMDAGGIGPREAPRLFDRHLGDALTFLVAAPGHARTLLDVGSGVGLPGIPIAIARPELAVTLLDQSDRRAWLARRAIRILGIDIAVLTRPVEGLDGAFDVLTFRGSLGVDAAADVIRSKRLGAPVGVFGFSRETTPPPSPDLDGLSVETLSVDSAVLDSPSWLLRMQSADPSTLPNQE